MPSQPSQAPPKPESLTAPRSDEKNGMHYELEKNTFSGKRHCATVVPLQYVFTTPWAQTQATSLTWVHQHVGHRI